MTHRWILFTCIVYFLACIGLAIKAACFGVRPDGASFTCGHAEYMVLHIVLLPSTLLFYLPMAREFVDHIDDIVPRIDFVLSCLLTASNTFLFYAFLRVFRRKQIISKEDSKDVNHLK